MKDPKKTNKYIQRDLASARVNVSSIVWRGLIKPGKFARTPVCKVIIDGCSEDETGSLGQKKLDGRQLAERKLHF